MIAGAKPWQIVLIAVCCLGAVGMLVYQLTAGSNEVHLADSVTLIDISTGDLFRAKLPTRKAVGYPAKNPETQRLTLLPVVAKDGKWYIVRHYLPGLEDEMKAVGVGAVTDFKTGEVKPTSDKPKSVSVW